MKTVLILLFILFAYCFYLDSISWQNVPYKVVKDSCLLLGKNYFLNFKNTKWKHINMK